MTSNIRIYNRFTGYTPKDCACEWCLHHGDKDRPCLLDKWEERLAAAKCEHGADKGDAGHV